MKNHMYFLAAFFAFAVSHSTAKAQLYWDTNDANTGATSDGLGNASGTWSGQAVSADYNGNGVVDAADYILWRKDPGTYNGDPAGYNAYRSQFGGANVAGNSNWTTDPNGDIATVPFTLNQAAVFAAGSNANGTYTVTLGTPQSAASLTFEDSANVTMVGDATTPLTLSSSASNVNVTGAATQLATIDAVISGTNLHKVGGGTLILGGTNMTTNSLSNNYSGNTIITSAASPATSTIQLNSSNVIPDTSVVVLQGSGGTGGNNAILQLTGMTETVRSVSGVFGYIDVGNSGVLTINDQVGDVYTLGNFGSSAHLRAADFGKYDKIGSGKLVLANDAGSNFNGEFILTNGTLAYSRNGALGSGSTSRLTVKGGQLTRSTTAATLTYGVGRVYLHVFRYDNSPDPNQTNQFGAATVTTLKEVNVEFNITNTPAGTGTVNFLGTIQNNDFSETSPPDRGITKTGNGILVFLNNNTPGNSYKGPTTILEGTLRVGSTNVSNLDGRIGDGLGVVNLSGGTLQYNGNLSSDSPTARQITISNPINVTADSIVSLTGGAVNHTLGYQMDFTGALSGTGGTLSFRNDHTGTCNIGNSCTFEPTFFANGFDFDRPITLLEPQGPNLNRFTELRGGNTSGDQEFSGDISGGGRFRRIGDGGTTILSGNNTYTGNTTIEDGTLSITHAYLADTADVIFNNTTLTPIFNLDFTGTDTIDQLFFGDGVNPLVAQAPGTWGEIGSGADHETALITGTGLLLVPTPSAGSGLGAGAVPEPTTAMLMMFSLGLLTIRRRKECQQTQ